MLGIEDTEVFTVVKIRPKSIFRERRKHVKIFFFFFFFPGGWGEGEEEAFLDNSDLGFLLSLLKTKSFTMCVSKNL